jgi:hypothetical protein
MEAKDLMIGDKLKTVFDQKIVEVKEIKQNCIYTEGNAYEYNEIEPIPLTPDILEKIGFGTERNIGHIIDDWDGTQIIYNSWDHNLRIIKNYKTRLDIETFDDIAVHELQHALRLCGIEKEIVL